jgi:hypothetical protein
VSAVLGDAVNFDWSNQPVLRHGRRAEYYWEGPTGTGARIASALFGWQQLRFEVTEDAGNGTDGGRWLHTPDQGIFFAQTDTAGNIVISEDRLRAVMDKAHADNGDLSILLQHALGSSWDAELDAFRHASDHNSVVWLHKTG